MKVRKRLIVLIAVFSSVWLIGCSEQKSKASIPTFETADLQQGRAIWMQVCRNCHLTGVAGAPAIGDSQAWVPRIGKGTDALYRSAIYGIKSDGKWMMPPRGGKDSLSDSQVRLAVNYKLAAVDMLKDASLSPTLPQKE